MARIATQLHAALQQWTFPNPEVTMVNAGDSQVVIVPANSTYYG
jgi:hypothetical protein